MKQTSVWQCSCGHIEHGELPDDCKKCLAVGKFLRVPEDEIEEKVAENVLAATQNEDYEEDEDEN